MYCNSVSMKAPLLVAVLTAIFSSGSVSASSSSSRLLQTHRQWYVCLPPHDTRLYDTLHIRPNATLADIQRSYRRLSRNYHPDKRKQRNLTIGGSEEAKLEEDDSCKRLAQISQAYDILKDDQTRLLYHRYGIVDGEEGAVRLLLSGSALGRASREAPHWEADSTPEQCRLLELIGYPRKIEDSEVGHILHMHHIQRVHYLAAAITERLRPLVEGTISQEVFVEHTYQEYNALKNTALGVQILRCVGRAYEVEGYRVLRLMRKSRRGNKHEMRHFGSSRKYHTHHKIIDLMRDSWHDAKHLCGAAWSSAKVMMVEHQLKTLQENHELWKQKAKKEKIFQTRGGKKYCDDFDLSHFASNIGMLLDEIAFDDDIGDVGLSDDEDDIINVDQADDAYFHHLQNEKAYTALLSVHQMDVLWRLTKIEINRTIREACQWILAPTEHVVDGNMVEDGWYAFSPSEQSPYHDDWHHHPYFQSSVHHSHVQSRHYKKDGWVGLDGNVVSMEVGRLRAAAALVLVGDIMVRCSKEGTGWK